MISDGWAGKGRSSGTEPSPAGRWEKPLCDDARSEQWLFRGQGRGCAGFLKKGVCKQQREVASTGQLGAGRQKGRPLYANKTGRELKIAHRNTQGGRKQAKWMEIRKGLQEEDVQVYAVTETQLRYLEELPVIGECV